MPCILRLARGSDIQQIAVMSRCLIEVGLRGQSLDVPQDEVRIVGGLGLLPEVLVRRVRDEVEPGETAHVAECVGNMAAIGLNVYGGDILDLPRRMWNPQTLEEHALDWGLYEQFAQAASKAAGAPAS